MDVNFTDEELFALVQNDHERAFSILFDRYKSMLYKHVFQRTGSEFQTEEILQEIFISLWRNRMTINVKDSLSPYLIGAARKAVFATYAKSSRANMLAQQQAIRTEEAIEYPAEEFLLARELENMLDREVQKMPSTMQKIFILSRKDEISVREIAATLGISEQTVKNNITMALQRLRGKLETKHFIKIIPFFWFLN